MSGPALRNVLLASVTGLVIFLDQLTKLHIMQTMRLHESIPIVPNLFSLTYIRNPGAAFGLLAGSSNAFRMVFFGLTSIFALVLLCTILFRMPERDWVGRLSVAGILGGAIGNLIDRLRYGEVIDFLDVYVENYHWPAFNVADSAITVGVIFLIIHFAFEKKIRPLLNIPLRPPLPLSRLLIKAARGGRVRKITLRLEETGRSPSRARAQA